jgi:hypothetical protein
MSWQSVGDGKVGGHDGGAFPLELIEWIVSYRGIVQGAPSLQEE